MKRILVYLVGLNLQAAGIVLNISTGLGVAALSSTIYSTSRIFGLSLGTASIIWYLIFVVLQCIMSRQVKKEFLLEIPLSFIFGYLNDFYDGIIHIAPTEIYQSVLLFAVAVSCISMGVYLTSKTNLVLNPGDGIVKTISTVWGKPFHFIKNCFDIAMISGAVLLALVTRSPISGIGVGTVASALLIGRFIKLWDWSLGKRLNKFLVAKE